MIDIDKKIEKIEKNCIETAKKELNIMKEENDKICEQRISEKIDIYKDELQKKYFDEINKINREYNRNIFDYEMTEKKKINSFKETLINNIGNKIKLEFQNFVNTAEYENYLLNTIENTLSKTSIGKCTIYVTENDYYKFADIISNKFNIEVTKTSNDYIGGCILVNKENKISIDNTLKTNILEEIKNINL